MSSELSNQQRLWLACKSGDLAAATQALELANVDVNAAEAEDGYTPLHYAAKGGFAAIIDLLVRKGSAGGA